MKGIFPFYYFYFRLLAVCRNKPCYFCCCSVTQLCPTLCNLMDCSTPGFPVHRQLPKFAQTYVHQVGDAIQPPHPLLLLLPSIFPSIRVFSNESSLHIRWPKYWSFSIRSSNEYSGWFSELTLGLTGLISLQSLVLSFLYDPTLTSHIHDYWENQSFD